MSQAAKSYAELKLALVKLQPVAVEITGIESPLLIHQFTMNEIEKIDAEQDENAERHIRKKVLRFLNGMDAEITEQDCTDLGLYFTGWQVREIYTKALKLNGFGPEALREAEKN